MMKRTILMLMVMLLTMGLMLGGCGEPKNQDEQQNPPQQEEQQQSEISTLTGEFQGLADGHSAEIIVDGEPKVYQFFDEAVIDVLETLDTGVVIQFDVETSADSDAQTIVKLYETPAQG